MIAKIWHGAPRWNGIINKHFPCKIGKYEYGPGLYTTTSYLNAKMYSGNSKPILFEFDTNLQLLEHKKIEYNILKDFLYQYKITNYKKIDKDIKRYVFYYDNLYPMSYFINLCVDWKSLSGKNSIYVLDFLISLNIDAHIVRSMSYYGSPVQWIIFYNYKKIERTYKVEKIEREMYDLPIIF